MEKNGLNLTGERIFWMDVVRFVAILLVVFTHAHCFAGLGDIAGDRTHDIIVTSIFFSVDRWGVVLFLMLSGALMLTKEMHRPFGFRWKRILLFVFLTSFWSIVTNVSFYFVTKQHPFWEAVRIAIKKNNVLWGGDTGEATHLWYMFLIILFYTTLPFVAAMLKNLSHKEVFLYILFSLLLFSLPLLYNIDGSHRYVTFLDRLFRDFFNIWIAYFVVGWLVCQDTVLTRFIEARRRQGTILLVVTMGLCVLLPLAYEYMCHASMPRLHEYSMSPFVFVGGLALFLLLREYADQMSKGRSAVSAIAKASFGIFLTHFAFIFPLAHFLPQWMEGASKDILTVVLFFLDFFCGWMFTIGLLKFKATKWLVA